MEVMRCFACKRPLFRSASPGLHVGPKCAKDRGLLPDRALRLRKVEDTGREVDPRQIDWILSLPTIGEADRDATRRAFSKPAAFVVLHQGSDLEA